MFAKVFKVLTVSPPKISIFLHFPLPACGFSTSLNLCARINYRIPSKYRKWKPKPITPVEEDDTSEENRLDRLLQQSLQIPGSGKQVFVVQPYIKWGPLKKRNTTPELQLMEAVKLIKTLREWTVVDETIIPLTSFHKNVVFGSGSLETLKCKIKNNPKITAVFVSINTLTVSQQQTLESIFEVPVFDRYTVIMYIFKEHAQTKEAKLQVQLAQLPYLWTVLSGFGHGVDEKLGVAGSFLGGSGPKLLSDRKEVFRIREAKLKKEIAEIRSHREMVRKQRDKTEIPVVAVVGYTNAGKTSLIKALTGKKSLDPQDYLFATLDVTSHLGKLPSGLEAFFVDTLGFISDIPTYLIESFVCTLEDAAAAHVIVHVRDISHPDTVAQNENVLETLSKLNVPEKTLENIITVGNKVDLVDRKAFKNDEGMILVSSTTMMGIDILRQEIEKKILEASDKSRIVIKVKTGGEEYLWLHEWATIVKETPDGNNNNYMLLETIISSSVLAKFKHYFIKNYKR